MGFAFALLTLLILATGIFFGALWLLGVIIFNINGKFKYNNGKITKPIMLGLDFLAKILKNPILSAAFGFASIGYFFILNGANGWGLEEKSYKETFTFIGKYIDDWRNSEEQTITIVVIEEGSDDTVLSGVNFYKEKNVFSCEKFEQNEDGSYKGQVSVNKNVDEYKLIVLASGYLVDTIWITNGVKLDTIGLVSGINASTNEMLKKLICD